MLLISRLINRPGLRIFHSKRSNLNAVQYSTVNAVQYSTVFTARVSQDILVTPNLVMSDLQQ